MGPSSHYDAAKMLNGCTFVMSRQTSSLLHHSLEGNMSFFRMYVLPDLSLQAWNAFQVNLLSLSLLLTLLTCVHTLQPFMNNTRCSHGIQAWRFQTSMLLNTLVDICGKDLSSHVLWIFAHFVKDSLQLITSVYTQITPSRARYNIHIYI
jgi:hypothetical protein